MRTITLQQAASVAKILHEECGYRIDPRELASFTYHVQKSSCTEYRFMGALGFGGKFRNNGNHNNMPYVDCYSEHETPERQTMIDAANKRLADLFEDPTP